MKSSTIDPSSLIVHICARQEWLIAMQGDAYQAPSLGSEGFIHASRPSQLLDVANRFYRSSSDLVVLWIDPVLLIPELRWEAADGQIFPHIYGEINTNAVVSVQDILPDADGEYRILSQP